MFARLLSPHAFLSAGCHSFAYNRQARLRGRQSQGQCGADAALHPAAAALNRSHAEGCCLHLCVRERQHRSHWCATSEYPQILQLRRLGGGELIVDYSLLTAHIPVSCSGVPHSAEIIAATNECATSDCDR